MLVFSSLMCGLSGAGVYRLKESHAGSMTLGYCAGPARSASEEAAPSAPTC